VVGDNANVEQINPTKDILDIQSTNVLIGGSNAQVIFVDNVINGT